TVSDRWSCWFSQINTCLGKLTLYVACTHKIAIGDSDLIRIGPLCGLKSDIWRGQRSWSSVKPDIGGLNHLGNTLGFAFERAVKFVRTAASWLNSNNSKMFDDIGLLHDRGRFHRNFLDECARCAHSGINPHDRREVELRNNLG